MVATPRSAAMVWRRWECDVVSSAVSPVMKAGASTNAATVVVTRTTIETVRMVEMDLNAASLERLANWATNTGMNVADSTPPNTMS